VKVIGELISDKVYNIETDGSVLFLRSNYGELKLLNKDNLNYILTNPWKNIDYFKENNKHYFCSDVYDGLSIYIFGNTIEELLNNLTLCCNINQ